MSLYGTSPFDLHQNTVGDQPVFLTTFSAIALPTYNLRFVANTANMQTTSVIPANNSSAFGTFAVAYLPNVSSSSVNEVLTIGLSSPADSLVLKTSYAASTHTFGLYLNGSLICSTDVPHVIGTNDELVLFITKTMSRLSFTCVRVDSLAIAGSCAVDYTTSNSISSIIIGRATAPAGVFTYFLGDMWYYARALASFEYKLHTNNFKQLYGLPLVGSIFS